MFDFLINHARQHVWCAPSQDRQVQLKLARLTPINGVEDYWQVLWERIPLPSQDERYHVYQLGQRHPRLLGLLPKKGVWIPLSEHCNRNNLIVDLYSKRGISYPRTLAYLLINKDQNLLLAVKEHPRVDFNLSQESLFLRVYSNAYFSSDRADPEEDYTYVGGGHVDRVESLYLWQRDYHDRMAMKGVVYAYHNGRLVSDLSPAFITVGDMVEYVHDTTIKRVVEFKVKDLATFNSILDKKRKYLLHHGGMLNDTIEYRDDIDLWLIRREPTGRWKGVYFHKNQEDAMRMVTHRDYSIPVPYVDAYVADHTDFTSADQLTVRMHVRDSGFYRPLVYEHNRIHELYKLSDEEVKAAMLGLDSTVPEWRADNLEQSMYTAIMRSDGMSIDRQMVQSAYGYNAMSVLLANTPQRVVVDPTRNYVTLPFGLRYNSTLYEYDSKGILLTYRTHKVGDRYYPSDVNCSYVEGIVGLGGLYMGDRYGNHTQVIPGEHNYRFYRAPIIGGRVSDRWEDVSDTEHYTYASGKVVWNHDQTKWYGMIRSDAEFLTYRFDLDRRDGLLVFSILSKELREGKEFTRPLGVPPGKLELWLNGKTLIEGLDFRVRWPEVVITNKEYLVEGSQSIVVRGTGFCQTDLTRHPVEDYGFIEHGLLSRNSRFDLRDDRVVKCTVRGQLVLKEDLHFSEADDGVYHPQLKNGSPYLVDEIVVPMRGLSVDDTYSLREKSRAVDGRVSDYLGRKIPDLEKEHPSMIPERYMVHSPFCSKIIYDLMNGLLATDGRLGRHYSDQDIRAWLKGYETWLDYDPTQRGLEVDDRYVIIHPHNRLVELELDIYQYTFVERVIRLYLFNKVDLTRFISVRLS